MSVSIFPLPFRVRNRISGLRKSIHRCLFATTALRLALVVLTGTLVSLPLLQSPASATSVYHVVTFEENDNPSDGVYATQTENAATPLTAFTALSPAFSNSGYTFVGWNTASNGTGTPYSDGETYSFASDLVLFAQWQGSYHVVTFYENDSPSDSVYASQTANSSQSLTSFTSLTPNFTNTGYSFSGWNTSPNGSGASYANGAIYSFTSDLSLYAQWSANASVAVTFADNGGTGIVGPLSAPSGTSVVLPSGAGLSNPGYTFAGWNTQANGLGTAYTAGSTVTVTSNLTLYAQWSANASVAVTFVDNGGTGTVASLSAPSGSSVVLPSGTALSNSGSAFTGWNTQANGLGTAYTAGSTVTVTSNLTLYAQWTTSKFVVTFDTDGGVTSVPSEQYTPSGAPVALPSATLAGYTFEGWFTASSGGTLVGGAGAPYAPTDSVTLYAQWSASTPASSTSTTAVVLTFSANGGSGSLAPVDLTGGASTDLPGAAFIRPGYVFEGWSTSAKGKATVYAAGQSFAPTTSETLYAVWRRAAAVAILYGDVGDFPHFTTTLTPALARQVMKLALVVRARRCREVELLGYTASTGLGSLDRSVSARRAQAVARALRADLRRLHVRGVAIRASGEGSIDRRTASVYSRVEVFLA
ncbi:MAG: InlB B-repeat-containing protein [Acidimicrobiales bacterium]